MTTARESWPLRRAGPLHRETRPSWSGCTCPPSTPPPTRWPAGWMEQAGLRSWQDAAGNQCGRREGRTPGLPALLLGSHLDTVPDAGSYDGMLGVVLAIAVAERLRDADLPFALEVDRLQRRGGHPLRHGAARHLRRSPGTGARSGGTCATATASRCTRRSRSSASTRAGSARPPARPRSWSATSRRTSSRGRSSRPRTARSATSPRSPVPGGSGSAIIGEARHAGGTPYPRRRDALVGASEAITTIERMARASGDEGCIATVGRIEVQPGAVNVIPGRADLSLDLRAATDAERDAMWDAMRGEIERLCAARGLRLEVVEHHTAPAVPCAPWLQEAVVRRHPQHRRRRPDGAVEPGRPRRDGDRPRPPTWGCCSSGATTASATTPTRTCASTTWPPRWTRSRPRAPGRRGGGGAVRIDERITDRYADLSPQEQRAAQTLLDHLDELATYRSAELAELAGCRRRR